MPHLRKAGGVTVDVYSDTGRKSICIEVLGDLLADRNINKSDRRAIARVLDILALPTQSEVDLVVAAFPDRTALRLAEAVAGYGDAGLKVVMLAKALHKAGRTDAASVVNITASLWNNFNVSGKWEYAEPGVFRWIGG